MNIVILSGGTGSIALQTGLYSMLDKNIDGIDTKVIVNAYDNGLSTGAVRRVMNGHILGPSDVRKNQATRLKLEKPDSPWNKLDIRFTCESSKARAFCQHEIEKLFKNMPLVDSGNYSVAPERQMTDAINAYFSSPFADKIDYNDFSLANIIYAGLAKMNGNSLRAAARIMAEIIGIKDNVILNDDTSLFLGAITKSGKRVVDEGDIVSWGKVDDPFVDVFFTDAAGVESVPVLCKEAADALLAADLIILSSGTQWSSLIPTYASVGFKEVIEKCKAKIIMVMNRQPDTDSPGQTACDLIQLLVARYFPKNSINLVVDSTGHNSMNTVDSPTMDVLASIHYANLEYGAVGGHGVATKHHPQRLAHAIGKSYFGDLVNSDHYMFDYDDTLVGRGNNQPRSSALNRHLIKQLKKKASVSICTGNSIKAISFQLYDAEYQYSLDDFSTEIPTAKLDPQLDPLTVFADGGINLYEYNMRRDDDDAAKSKFIMCVDNGSIIPNGDLQKVTSLLVQSGIPRSKIENRGDVIISIRPIDPEYRPIVLSLVKMITIGTGLDVVMAGRTTIDISYPSVSKASAVSYILSKGVGSITFVGDELHGGNDAPVFQMIDHRVKCVSVKDPAETAFFLLSMLSQPRGY